MLTKKQHELLLFINERVSKTGVSPSFEEMKEALDLRSKSGVHRLIKALEERGFIRRLPNRARALEVVKLPPQVERAAAAAPRAPGFTASVVEGRFNEKRQSPIRSPSQSPNQSPTVQGAGEHDLPVLGRIAAGTPIEAIQHEVDRITAPDALVGAGEHFVLEVKGESMIDAGIHDGDFVIIRRGDTAGNGDIVVALVDDEEATLKRFRKKGGTIALEAANPDFETRIYGPDRVAVQGKLVGLMRRYH